MRGEELPEERMLSLSKSWFSRSVSNGAINECSSDGIPDTALPREGGLEDREVWGSFSTLRQLSMRRSRPAGEVEREVGSGSPSMTPRNVTPLTPLTPLKWKSNACEHEEEGKSLEPSTPGPDARTDVLADEKAMEKGEEEQTVDLNNGLNMHDRTKSMDNFVKAQMETEQNPGSDSPDGLERKPSSGEDVMTMTIEFLRARLLSERSASKAAKQRALQLGKKVMALEQKLEQAVEDRKKAETAAKDSILKLKAAGTSIEVLDKTAGEGNDKATSGPTEGSLITTSSTSNGEGQEKELQEEQQDTSRAGSNGTPNERKDSDQALPAAPSKMGEPLVDKGRLDVLSTPQKCGVLPKSTKGQESRAAVEDRLRNMWNQISEEMTALAGERSQEDLVREELMSWMEQVPTVLQDIIPKNSLTPEQSMSGGVKKLISHYSNEGLADDSVAVPLKEVRKEADSGRQFRDVKSGPPSEVPQGKGQLEAEAKRAAAMLEEFEAQESVQRDWEKKYYESQRKLEQFKGDHHDDGDRFPARHQPSRRDSLPLDYKRAPRGSPEAFSRFPHRVAKSKSSNDFIRRMSNEHPPDINAPNYDALYTDFDTGSGDRFRQPARGGGHPDAMYNNIGTGYRRRSLDMAYVNQSPMQQEHAVTPSRLTEAGHQGWSDRQFEPEPLDTYNNQASRDGGYLSYSEGGPLSRKEPFRPLQAPTNRSTEDLYRSSQPDYRREQWDDRWIRDGWGLQEAGEERGGQYAQSGYSTANGRTERDNYRHREGEGSGRSIQADGTDRHQDRRSISDNADWPSVEDYDPPNRSQEPGLTLETQQSYVGHPPRTSTDRPPNGYHNFRGSSEDMQFRERHDINEGPYERRRDTQTNLISGHQYAPHPDPSGGRVDRNGDTKTEPLLSLGYGPAYDAPKEDSPVRQLSMEGANKNVSDVLRALKIAKTNIQNANLKEQRFRGVQAPPTTQPPTRYTQAPPLEGPGHLQESYRHTKPHEHAGVRAPLTTSLYSSPNGVTHQKVNGQDNREAIHHPQVSPNGAANEHDSYIDKLNVGNGIQFFFS